MTFAPQSEELIGTIESVLSHDIIHEVNNDGDHTYLHVQEDCKTQLPVSNEAMSITVPLTNIGLDVVQFDKSFITLKVAVNFALNGISTSSVSTTPLREAIKVFVGLKHSPECLGEYSIYHKGKQIAGTLQSYGTTEAFLYHVYRGQDDIMHRCGVHSVAEEVAKGDLSSVCGKYVNLQELSEASVAGNGITVNFTFLIPFNDILAFQQFRDYPSALFGQLELKFKFNKWAFVCLPCDPAATIKTSLLRTPPSSGDPRLNIPNLDTVACRITREYTQIGDSFNGITAVTVDGTTYRFTPTVGNITLTPQNISINECYSTLVGYRISSDALESMRMKFESEPWVKFTQNIHFLQYSQGASALGLNVSQQTYLNNTTDFIIMYPRTQHEVAGTISKNPCLQDLSLQVMNRKYPEMPLDTNSERYAQIMLNASDNFHQPPLREYAQSISTARVLINDAGAVSTLTPAEDLTSHITTIKVERPSAMGLICDGLDSNGEQVSVRLSAKPLTTNTTYDEYCTKSPPPPVLITVNDAFFIFNSKDGGQCIYSDRNFNEVLPAFMSA